MSIASDMTFADESPPKKPKQYSLSWVSGIMTKVRKSGVTEIDIFDAVFPESPQRLVFDQLQKHMMELKESILKNDMTDNELSAQLLRIVKARMALQGMYDDVAQAMHDEVTNGR
jgi:hypothetical protein